MLDSKRTVMEIKNDFGEFISRLHMMWKESLNLKAQEQEQQQKNKEQKLRKKKQNIQIFEAFGMSTKKCQMYVIYNKEKKGTEEIFEKTVIENFSQINGRQKTTDLKTSENTKEENCQKQRTMKQTYV